MTLVIIFGFIACQKEENALPMVEKGKKSMSAEDEALYNSIVDFRHKLLTQDYTAEENIATSDAILLMEASLNLTYRNIDTYRYATQNFEDNIVADRTFTNITVEYSTLYTTYQNILANIRQTNRNITESFKNLRVVDLELDANNNISIKTTFEVEMYGANNSFDFVNQAIENSINNRFYPTIVVCMYDVESTPPNSFMSSMLDASDRSWLRNHLYTDATGSEDYFVHSYSHINPYVFLSPSYGYFGVQNIQHIVNSCEQGSDKTVVTISLTKRTLIDQWESGYNLYGDNNKCFASQEMRIGCKAYVVWGQLATDPNDIDENWQEM